MRRPRGLYWNKLVGHMPQVGLAKQRRVLALAAALSLFALSLLASLPHPWHKDTGGRACAVCQAYRTPAETPGAPVRIEPSPAPGIEAPCLQVPDERSPALIARIARAPPF